VTGKTTIAGGKIETDSITSGQIATDAITANELQANSVIAGKIAVDAVLANNIKAGAVVAGKLAADAVVATNVAADAILARNIKAGEILASHIRTGTITAASGVIGDLDASKITVGKITAAQMATGTITAASGVIAEIDASKITVGKLTAAQMATGTITAASGVIGSIDAAKITVGQISASQLAADAIDGKTITGVTITGGLFKTAPSGNRWEMGGKDTWMGKANTLLGFSGRSDEVAPAQVYTDALGRVTLTGAQYSPTTSGTGIHPVAMLQVGSDSSGGLGDPLSPGSGTGVYITGRTHYWNGDVRDSLTDAGEFQINTSGIMSGQNVDQYAGLTVRSVVTGHTGPYKTQARLWTQSTTGSSSVDLTPTGVDIRGKSITLASESGGTRLTVDATSVTASIAMKANSGLTVTGTTTTGAINASGKLTVSSGGASIRGELIDADDTGWVTCSLKAGYGWQNGVTGEPIQVRKKFGVVYIRGAVSNTGITASSSHTVASLPPGFAPTKNVVNSCGTSSGAASAVAFIESGGNLQIRTNGVVSGYYFFGGFTWTTD